MRPVNFTSILADPLDNRVVLTVDSAQQLLRSWPVDVTGNAGTVQHYGPYTRNQEDLSGAVILGSSTGINGTFYSPEDMTSMELTADIYIDRTSIEVFIDGGAYSYSVARKPDVKNTEGFHFWGNNIDIKNLEVYTVKSIWQ